ncbi:MAG TPA: EamA/RhaT family transporter [Desulfobacteraceae bacterium]|nr:EamA/RhaT family transporter [Desulfobacteraceae bacterium]
MPYIYAMGAVLCWASLPAAIGSGLTGLSVPALMAVSFTSAAIFLYARDILATRSFRIFVPKILPSLLGVWGIFLYHFLYYKTMDLAPMAEGTILATTWSFWIVVFSSVITFKRLRPAIFITACIGLLGAGMVIASGKSISFSSGHMVGYGFALLCGLIWSSFSVTLPLMKLDKDPMTAYTIYAAVISLCIFLMSGDTTLPGRTALLSAVYLGCVPLGLSFFFWNRALNTGNVTIIGYLTYLTPPLAVLMVSLIHGEQVSAQVLSGMGVIIGAALLGKFFLKDPANA